jgi:serine protease Do
MRFARTPLAAAVAMALVGAGTAAGAWTLPDWLHKHDTTTVAAASTPTATPSAAIEPIPTGGAPNFRAIVKAEGPAVVGVTVSGLHDADQDDAAPSFDDDPFFRFFRGLPGFQNMPRGVQPFRGQGSGFIVSADGVILTNAHVVREAKQVTVKLSDRREFSAKVLGSDPATDIAVLKIEATGLPTVHLGDSKSVQVGDYVLAIGAPFGFEQTATQGIVSAKGRSLPGDSYVPFIQTDAAVNPGNSGGPLFDAAGRVVGINAQIYSRSGGFQGLAFAIPIDVALHVKDEVVAHGHVEHARLGVMLQDLTAPLAESFGMKSPDGALVASVAKGSAAAEAGLKAGDVITALDGKPVSTAGEVSSAVGSAKPNDRLALSVWRDKSSRELSVSLGKADDEPAVTVAKGQSGSLGLAVRPLQRGELRESGLDHGLLIERASGPAALAGVQAGDVLLALNGKPVSNVEQVREAMHGKPKHVALLISRDGQQIFVPVNLG